MQSARRLRERVSATNPAFRSSSRFTEASGIASSLTTLQSWFGAGAEALVIDDGSADDTFEQAERYAARHAHVLVHRLPRHRGKGGAIRAAIPLVRADLVVLMDVDLAAFSIAQLVQRSVDGLATAEMVVGNRRHDGSYSSGSGAPVRFPLSPPSDRPRLQRVRALGAPRELARHAMRVAGIPPLWCLATIAPALSVEGFALDVEMLLVARALDVRLSEVPVDVGVTNRRRAASHCSRAPGRWHRTS